MIITIKVKPGSRREDVRIVNDMLVVHVKAPATDGKANHAVVGYLAERLGVAKSHINIVSGHTSRFKRIEMSEADANSLMAMASASGK